MTSDRSSPTKNILRRWIGPIILAAALVLFFAFDLHHVVSFETLANERDRLHNFVAENPISAPLFMIVIYAAATMLSLPIGAVLTLAYGFLLGTVLSTVVVSIGATVGAVGLFLIARSAAGERWRQPVERALARLDGGFKESAFQYLLILRLIPVMPFWLVNIVPAFAGVTLRQYIAATFLGILPGTVVYCSVGAGLDAVFARGETPDISLLLDPALLLPLTGLALLATLPLLYKRWRGSQKNQTECQTIPPAE